MFYSNVMIHDQYESKDLSYSVTNRSNGVSVDDLRYDVPGGKWYKRDFIVLSRMRVFHRSLALLGLVFAVRHNRNLMVHLLVKVVAA